MYNPEWIDLDEILTSDTVREHTCDCCIYRHYDWTVGEFDCPAHEDLLSDKCYQKAQGKKILAAIQTADEILKTVIGRR